LGSEHFCFRVARDAGVIGTEQMPDVSTRPGGSLSNAALFGFGPFVNENPNGHHPGSWQRIGPASEQVFNRQLKNARIQSASNLTECRCPKRSRDTRAAGEQARLWNARPEAVGQVEYFAAYLYFLTFRDPKSPCDRQIELPKTWSGDITAIHGA